MHATSRNLRLWPRFWLAPGRHLGQTSEGPPRTEMVASHQVHGRQVECVSRPVACGSAASRANTEQQVRGACGFSHCDSFKSAWEQWCPSICSPSRAFRDDGAGKTRVQQTRAAALHAWAAEHHAATSDGVASVVERSQTSAPSLQAALLCDHVLSTVVESVLVNCGPPRPGQVVASRASTIWSIAMATASGRRTST